MFLAKQTFVITYCLFVPNSHPICYLPLMNQFNVHLFLTISHLPIINYLVKFYNTISCELSETTNLKKILIAFRTVFTQNEVSLSNY